MLILFLIDLAWSLVLNYEIIRVKKIINEEITKEKVLNARKAIEDAYNVCYEVSDERVWEVTELLANAYKSIDSWINSWKN